MKKKNYLCVVIQFNSFFSETDIELQIITILVKFLPSKYVELSICVKNKESEKTVQHYFVGFAIFVYRIFSMKHRELLHIISCVIYNKKSYLASNHYLNTLWTGKVPKCVWTAASSQLFLAWLHKLLMIESQIVNLLTRHNGLRFLSFQNYFFKEGFLNRVLKYFKQQNCGFRTKHHIMFSKD